MTYHQLNVEQQDSAIDQIVEILNNRKLVLNGVLSLVTREGVEWALANYPETAEPLFAIDIVDEKNVLVSRKK